MVKNFKRISFCGILLIGTILKSTPAISDDATIEIVRDGAPNASIVIDSQAAKNTTFAAIELQTCIKKITGVILPIVKISPNSDESILKFPFIILIGENKYTKEMGVNITDLKADGYKILTEKNRLIIIGKDSTVVNPLKPLAYAEPGSCGTLQGVYRFLEDLGVRWFYPGTIGEVIPSQKEVIVKNINIKSEPYFTLRVGYSPVWPSSPENNIWDRRIGMGIGDLRPGTSYTHMFEYWPKKYFKTHPEYFAVNGGRRSPKYICFSNSGTRKQILKDAEEFFKTHDAQQYPYFPLYQNDGCIDSCECPLCQAKWDKTSGFWGNDSNIMAEAAIELANAIKEKYPDRKILLGAYAKYLLPPTNIEKFPDNIMIGLSRTSRTKLYADYIEKNINGLLEGWVKLKPEKILIYEYYTMSSRLIGLPMPAFHMIDKDIKYLKRLNEKNNKILVGEEIFALLNPTSAKDEHSRKYRYWWICINYYITAKLLWNPDLDVNLLLDDYFSKYFGPSAVPMKKLFTELEEIWSTDHHIKNYYADKNVPYNESYAFLDKDRFAPWTKTVLSLDNILKLKKYLEEAKKLSPNSPYKERIAFIEEGFLFTEKEARQQNSSRSLIVTEKKLNINPTKAFPSLEKLLETAIKEKWSCIKFCNNYTGQDIVYGTTAYLSYDKDNLYLCFLCQKPPDQGTFKIQATERDGNVWDDESIELFISPKLKSSRYFHIAINPNGVIADCDSYNNYSWDSNIKLRVNINKESWGLVLEIPFKDIGENPISGQEWAVNLYRNRYDSKNIGELQAWSPTGGSYHSPDKFGTIIFQ